MRNTSPRRARSSFALRAVALFLPMLCGANDDLKPTISVDVRLMELHASVWNKQGRAVAGLQESNFKVEEDGRPQSIRVSRQNDAPVALGLVVDNSGSMAAKRSDVTSAAVALARSSNPEDEMFIVNFNERVTFGLPDTRLFSASARELEDALLKPRSAGRTALYDAIGTAIAHLQKSGNQRKVLVVFSDGADNASRRTLADVLQEIGQTNTTIFTIGLFDEDDTDGNPDVLRRIAHASGGEIFLPGKLIEAVGICERIARDIRTQYTISYSPADQNFDGRFRAIKVTATGEHGQRLRVRTRTGYVASPGDGGARQ